MQPPWGEKLGFPKVTNRVNSLYNPVAALLQESRKFIRIYELRIR